LLGLAVVGTVVSEQEAKAHHCEHENNPHYKATEPIKVKGGKQESETP
jgi:hypothetical protein